MSIGLQIGIAALTTAVTVTVTIVINYFFSIPKKLKKEKEEETQKVLSKIDNLETHIEEIKNIQDRNYKKTDEDITLLKLGSQATIKNELKIRYEKWLKLGYAPVDAKDDLEKMYVIYHKLGSNGVMDHIREQFLDLPDERVVKNIKDEEQLNG